MFISYLLDAIVHYVACYSDILCLAQSVNAVYGLILDRLIPLRLNNVNPTGDSEIKSTELMSVATAINESSSAGRSHANCPSVLRPGVSFGTTYPRPALPIVAKRMPQLWSLLNLAMASLRAFSVLLPSILTNSSPWKTSAFCIKSSIFVQQVNTTLSKL